MKNLIIILLTSFLSSLATAQIEIYDFNTGTLSQNKFITACIGVNNPGVLSDSFATDGGKSFRASVSKGDAACGSSYRTEINFLKVDFANIEWLYWENLIPSWIADDPLPFSSGQIHASVNVPFYIRFYNSNADAVIQNSATHTTKLTTNRIIPLGYFQKGVWHRWLLHFKKSAFSDGFIELWADDKFMFRYDGPTADLIAGQSELDWYAKFGLYNWNNLLSAFPTKVTYTDNIKTGDSTATAADFMPNGTPAWIKVSGFDSYFKPSKK